MSTSTILEPLALDGNGDGNADADVSEAFTPVAVSDKAPVISKTKEVPKIWKWKLEGMTLVVLSVIVLSAALTLALLISIIVGDPQVKPHGAVLAENEFCATMGLEMLEKQGGNAVDAAVSTALCLAVVRPDIASKRFVFPRKELVFG
ncbi:Gamma-glutamyltransferase protein 3 (T03 family) [Fasciola gigantica]|uniref:Gamma-glutamyltransferase protein 3 (T03 family) n=1 Tax=Fasciola gigantica TaxID=46835 RepID=A0A504YYK1_FASGI|nr:Gamma-glutamyltransferase protein 3 (T03 family) [Fasciola gigantica]